MSVRSIDDTENPKMILQPCKLEPKLIELTKIHYYDANRKELNLSAASVSREICENDFNKNILIKRNIFGHRWVLKINEDGKVDEKKSKLKLVVYVLVFCSIVVAVAFGVFLSVDKDFLRFNRQHKLDTANIQNISSNITRLRQGQIFDPIRDKKETNVINVTNPSNSVKTNISTISYNYCSECTPNLEICIKLQPADKPQCKHALNQKDPTGCGGLCKINTHFCQELDKKVKVYQCSPLKNMLKCPDDFFSCGNMCISQRKRCDGAIDCSNKSDEENCACNLETHFHCGNFTSCLLKSKRCDTKIDCWDKSDEKNCSEVFHCPDEKLPCSNGQCISRRKFCDGIFDCSDQSDEPKGCQR